MENSSILPSQWSVPPEFHSRLGTQVGRQRPMVADGHLLLALHAPPRPESQSRVGRFFWRAPDGSWKSDQLGDGIAALEHLLDNYEECIQKLDDQEHASSSAVEYFEVLDQLTPIYRAAQNLCRVIQEARTMCPDFKDLINVRDRAYAIERTAELLFSGTKNALDSIVARQAEQQAQSSHQMATAAHRLNILAAFFFPVITLTAIFGVDLASVAYVFGFDYESPWARRMIPFVYLGVVFVGFLVGMILTRSINRKNS